jgi:hypothetical protein
MTIAALEPGTVAHRLVVATVPDRHPYLSAVLPDHVTHRQYGDPALPWAPSPRLGLDTVRAEAAVLDLIHVHFGVESMSVAALRAWTDEVRRRGIALVVTVHDLRNPHQRDPEPYEELLQILITSAHQLITLTSGAAEAIRRRWGRRATVVPHPPLAARALGTGHPPDGRCAPGRTVGIHLKSLRANVMDPAAVCRAAAAGARRAGGRLVVDLHPGVAEPRLLAELSSAAADGRYELRIHERFTDGELQDYLEQLDVSVLPYRFGTHSGWLELCHDLGTVAVVPDCGYYAEQWSASIVYGNNEREGLDAEGLATAVARALHLTGTGPGTGRSMRDHLRRRAGARDSRTAHAAIYAEAVGQARSDHRTVQR